MERVFVHYALRTGPRLNVRATKESLSLILKEIGFDEYDVSLWIVNERRMAQHHVEALEKRGPTDCLSFPFLQFSSPKVIEKGQSQNVHRFLGDLMICLPFVVKQAKKEEVDVSERFQHLMVHSCLHLVGYEHDKDEDWNAMLKEEDRLAGILGVRKYFD